MKTIILILLAFGMRGQNTWDKIKERDDVLHFYGSFAINEGAYQIQSFAFPKMKETKKVLISNGITLLAIFGKEWYDTKKKRPTGFSWDDIAVGSWAVPIYDIFNIVRYDFKNNKTIDAYEPR